MKYLLSIMIILLCSCTSYKAVVVSPDYIDSAFLEYTSCFESNSGITLPEPFSIVFNDDVLKVAQCHTNAPSKKKHILVNPTDWREMDILQREFTLFHEMGHCIMGLSHDDETFNFMILGLPSSETIEEFRDELFLDFFGIDYKLCEYE